MQIHQPRPQRRHLPFAGTLALGKPQQRHRLGFAVVKQRPTRAARQHPPQALPQQGFTMLMQGQQRLVTAAGSSGHGPATVSLPLDPQEAVQKVVAGVWVGFNVVDEHAGS